MDFALGNVFVIWNRIYAAVAVSNFIICRFPDSVAEVIFCFKSSGNNCFLELVGTSADVALKQSFLKFRGGRNCIPSIGLPLTRAGK